VDFYNIKFIPLKALLQAPVIALVVDDIYILHVEIF